MTAKQPQPFTWSPELIAQCLKQWSPPAGSAELRWNGKQWVTK